VNIDNGFGAAILAGQILRTAYKLKLKSQDAQAWLLTFDLLSSGFVLIYLDMSKPN
jgi:hypothetical protein